MKKPTNLEWPGRVAQPLHKNPEELKRARMLHEIFVIPAAEMSRLAQLTRHTRTPLLLDDRELRKRQRLACERFNIDPSELCL